MKKITLIFAITSLFIMPAVAFAEADFGFGHEGQLPDTTEAGAANRAAAAAGSQEVTKLKNPLNADSFEGLFRDILSDIIIPVTALIGVVFIIYAGFKFVTAQGKPEKVTEAKKRLMYVLIGVAIIIAAEVILDLLLNTLTQIADVNPT